MSHCISDHSTSFFYVPLWTDDIGHFVSTMEKDVRYQKVEKHDVPQYMLPYITRIFCEGTLYTEFRLLPEHFPDISLFESHFDPGCAPVLSDIYLCCFATGCLFMEFRIRYSRSDLDQIADFSFRFKNANSVDRDQPGKVRMIDAIPELLPENSGAAVFPGSSSFKNDCKMFHQIFMEEALPESELERHLVHLRRGYHREFPIPNTDEGYDMIFRPYEYDHWSGSQEGLVDLYHITDNKAANSYLTKYKPIQLSVSYRFMYLVLLDQRYSAIVLLGKIPHFASYTRVDREKMSSMISMLKTSFSFSIVSDDQLYQTVYSKMYMILGIDRLLADVRDNEEQIELLQNQERMNTEKMTSVFLFGLSILSLFSVLVDAAGYFDRIPILQSVSTVLSALCLFTIIVFYIFWWIRYRKE